MADVESSWPGWATERVEIVEYDPAWVRFGALECRGLEGLLQHWRVGDVEHVGSTAVPGLAAKPILDLQAPVVDLIAADDVAATLVGHDWHYVPPHVDRRPDRRFFVKVSDGHRAAHLHLLTAGGDRWHHQLAFRDALRTNPSLRDTYARLKAGLSERHPEDREAYSAGKRQFIEGAIRGVTG